MKLQKETESKKERKHGKWYDDACGTAFALELVGERWSLLIVRELMFGGRRFSDLRGGLPGISAKVLTERLESLEQAGIVMRRQLPPPVSAQVYELTRWGYAADDAIMTLGRWAAKSPHHDPTLPLSPASFMLSLRTMFDAERAGALATVAGIAIGKERFAARVGGGKLHAERGEEASPAFVFAAPVASVIAAAVYGKVPFEALGEAGFEFTGDRAAASRFIDCFNLPEKIA
jgi:DNA-binding HxlR family transcriptional regulator